MATELRKVTQLSWRKLITSEHGVEGMLVLKERAPKVASSGEAHSIIFNAGVAQGYSLALEEIYNLLSPDSKTDIDYENR